MPDEAERQKTYPLIVEKNGIRLAILNYTFGTNGLTVHEPNIVNYIDTAVIRQDLEKARLADPDFTIVTIHWGIEYQRTENKEQDYLAKYLLIMVPMPSLARIHMWYSLLRFVSGDDVSDTTRYLVVYSLGNFISNQRERYTDGGIMFAMDLEKHDGVPGSVTTLPTGMGLETCEKRQWNLFCPCSGIGR